MISLLEKYRSRLPVSAKTPIVSLGEGGTPLVRADRIAAAAGLAKGSVLLKCEGLNPTGSFKDRGMSLAVSKALEEGSRGLLCASTGNTAASAAAYAARAGLRCVVLLPKGQVALGKLSQSVMHGAEIVEVSGNFDQALRAGRALAQEAGFTLVNSTNAYRLQGQKTAAFEIVEQLGQAPDYQFMPVGNAGNITAYWSGYRELGGRGPKMMGFQAAGAAPLVLGRSVAFPKTVATAIRIGAPVSREGALAARDESGGLIGKVSDAEILSAWRRLAEEEGVFCEPSSAAGVAGLLKLAREKFPIGGVVVCILTGHGLKDQNAALKTPVKKRSLVPGRRFRL